LNRLQNPNHPGTNNLTSGGPINPVNGSVFYRLAYP